MAVESIEFDWRLGCLQMAVASIEFDGRLGCVLFALVFAAVWTSITRLTNEVWSDRIETTVSLEELTRELERLNEAITDLDESTAGCVGDGYAYTDKKIKRVVLTKATRSEIKALEKKVSKKVGRGEFQREMHHLKKELDDLKSNLAALYAKSTCSCGQETLRID